VLGVNRNANLGHNIFYNYVHLLLSFMTQYDNLIRSNSPMKSDRREQILDNDTFRCEIHEK